MTSSLPTAPAFGAPIPVVARPEVLDFLATRRSTSAVALAAPAPTGDQLADLLRLATRVPDHGKLAPWRFVILGADAKSVFADRLESLATARGDSRAVVKLAKLRAPPMGIAVISRTRASEIPLWEQQLSAGAVCATLLYAAQALGFGANWITDWYAYDLEAKALLGLDPAEQVAGFILIGTSIEPPQERERPDTAGLVSHWSP
jgi:nitroreductase